MNSHGTLILRTYYMNEPVINYHKQRRPFIIFPGIGIIFGQAGEPLAHIEILTRLGLSESQAKMIIEICPRGYFLNNNLVFYQGDHVEEGKCWELKEENYPLVKIFFNDLQKIFGLNENTKIFLGVKRGKIGDIWPTVNKVSPDFFIKTNF